MHENAYSRYRNLFGETSTNTHTYDNIKFPESTMDSNMIAVNRSFIAFIETTFGGGSFILLPLNNKGNFRISHNTPRVSGHKAQVLDIAFSPFDDYIIASAAADCIIRIWEIPENGPKSNLTTPLIELTGHERKVSVIQWNPIVENILISGGHDQYCLLWNIERAQIINKIDLEAGIFSLSFSYDGFKVATLMKNMKLAVFNPKSDEIEFGSTTFNFNRSARCVYLKNNNIFTSGSEDGSNRCLKIWDSNELCNCLCRLVVDYNPGLMLIHYEPEHSLIFMIGRGDSSICIFQIYDKEPYLEYLTKYQSNLVSQRCFAPFPSIGCNPNICEVSRIYRGLANGFCEVVSFVLPAMSSATVKDMFGPVRADTPTLTAEEYLAATSPADPKTVSKFYVADDKIVTNIKNTYSRPKSRDRYKYQSEQPNNFNEIHDRLMRIESRLEKLEKGNFTGMLPTIFNFSELFCLMIIILGYLIFHFLD